MTIIAGRKTTSDTTPQRKTKKNVEPKEKPESVSSEPKETNSEFVTKYDVSSKERYVDSTSQKSEFDRVLDELANISKDILSWNIIKATEKHFGGTEEENSHKIEAFLGAFIINAATELYNKGLQDAAFNKLEQAKKILEAKQKLEQETESVRVKLEESAIDVSDMLDLSF
ncbi:hypothetical protein AGMMS50276_10340 [Synergistales bacterium]|nr:hypothetical protein AGMMS50276_10340 [Synergistales bacterium]